MYRQTMNRQTMQIISFPLFRGSSRRTGYAPSLSLAGRLIRSKIPDDRQILVRSGRTIAMRMARAKRVSTFNVTNNYTNAAALRSHEMSLQRLRLPKIDVVLIDDAEARNQRPGRETKALQASHGWRLQGARQVARAGRHQGHRHRPQLCRRHGPLLPRRRCRLSADGRARLAAQATSAGGGVAARRAKERRRHARRRLQFGHPRHRRDRWRALQLHAGLN
jgi:hypothetical protein